MADQPQVVPWLQTRWSHLCGLHRSQRLPHALIVHGAKGLGKGEFATAFAHYLLCHSPQGDQPCGRCRACELNAAGGHPDLYQLAPEDTGKPIKVDQIRVLTDFINSTAQQGGYRVVVINPADAMNIAAANALLKMLEEPGQDTVLMLLTDRIGQLMPTIKSRCQRVECALPDSETAKQFVMAELKVDAEEAGNLLAVTNGAPVAAIDYSQSGLADQRSQLIKGLADVLKQRRSVVDVAQSWQKMDLELALGWFYSMLVDVARAKSTGTETVQHADARNMLLAVTRKVNAKALFELAEVVQEERKSLILRQNTNKQMMLERILLGWLAIVK